jgi:hypothetical protein
VKSTCAGPMYSQVIMAIALARMDPALHNTTMPVDCESLSGAFVLHCIDRAQRRLNHGWYSTGEVGRWNSDGTIAVFGHKCGMYKSSLCESVSEWLSLSAHPDAMCLAPPQSYCKQLMTRLFLHAIWSTCTKSRCLYNSYLLLAEPVCHWWQWWWSIARCCFGGPRPMV